MSNERDILIRALRASGSEREAVLAEQILPDAAAGGEAAAAAQGETPGQAYVRQQQEQVAAQAAAQLPEGIMSAEEIAEWEQRPAPKSGAEQQQRIAETDRVFDSLKYHQGQS